MKIKCTIIDSTTIRLEEDAKKGDIIDLKELQSVDLTNIESQIDRNKDVVLQKRIEEAKKNVQLEKEKEVNQLKADYEKQIINIESTKKLEIQKIENELNQKNREKELKLEQKINDLTNQLNFLNSNKDNEINKIKDHYEIQMKEESLKFAQQIANLKDNHNKETNDLNLEISKLKLNKTQLNNKQLGEQLENWCLKEYENYAVTGFQNCSFMKANDSKKESITDAKETKPDFIFRIFNDSSLTGIELSSVCLEMKNQGLTGATKNSDHYEKLNKDRIKNNCEYALLVSELEWNNDNDAPIQRIPNYQKMYMVRPQYFISFLALLVALTNKYKDLLNSKAEKDIELKKKEEIVQQIEELKVTYLEKPLNTLENKINDINKYATSIYESSTKILQTCNTITIDTIKIMREKIETLSIKANKIKNL